MIANLTESLTIVTAIVALGAFIVALGAFCISLWESRRNNKVIVKMKKFSASEHYSQTATKGTHELEVWVTNCGIQMQNISMGLSFYGRGKSGTNHVPISLSGPSKDVAGSFLRGTTAKFVLSTVDKDVANFLGLLCDFKEQRPAINLYNSSFLACSFPIYSRWDWFRRLWNRLSLRFERRVGEGCEGKGVFKYQLPYFVIRSEKLWFFLSGLTEEEIAIVEETNRRA